MQHPVHVVAAASLCAVVSMSGQRVAAQEALEPALPQGASGTAVAHPDSPVVAAAVARATVAQAGPDARLARYEELCHSAARSLARGLLADDEEQKRALYLEAERHARAAAELMPERADGHFLVAAALGVRSELESVRLRIRMAGEVHEHARTALEHDPDHAGAHHVMGRLNLEAKRAPALARMLASHLFGSSLIRTASWEAAEAHLRRAAQLEPAALMHRLWLARLYIERGRREAARRELQTILSMEARSELDRQWQEEAGQELVRL